MKLNECLKMIHESMNLTIDECYEMIQTKNYYIPSEWTIRFYDNNNIAYGEKIMIPTTIKIADLYDDWYGDCNSCPENGEFVFGITIAQESTGKSYLIETPYEFTFEELMMAIEDEFF